MSDPVKSWMEQRNEQKQEAKTILLSLVPRFKAAGVAYVVAYYNGEGDSGQIEEICFFGPDTDQDTVYAARSQGDIDGPTMGEVSLTDPTDDNAKTVHLDAFFDQFTPDGYEDNDGGFGAVILDVEAAKIRVNSASRFTDYSTEDYEV